MPKWKILNWENFLDQHPVTKILMGDLLIVLNTERAQSVINIQKLSIGLK
jgi:hypothetical protein